MGSGHGSVILAGSINVDLIVGVERLPRPGETVHGHRFVRQGGGKAANQAVAVSRMGVAATLIGAVGDDDLGRAALEGLSAEGVRVDRCQVIPDEHTGLAMIIVDDAGENQIAVAPGAVERVDAEVVGAALAGLEPPPGSVCLLTLELEEAAVLAVVRWAADRRLPIVLNPAPARRLPEEVVSARPILTPNETEAAWLAGVEDPGEAAARLAQRTGAPVVVSLGPRGALLWAHDEATAMPAFPVSPVDTTGAGDALNGILAAELARGAALSDALRLAIVGAALSTTLPGAQAGLPTRDALLAAAT